LSRNVTPLVYQLVVCAHAIALHDRGRYPDHVPDAALTETELVRQAPPRAVASRSQLEGADYAKIPKSAFPGYSTGPASAAQRPGRKVLTATIPFVVA